MNFFKILFELYCSEKRRNYSKERMSSYQERQLNKLLHYVYDHSMYYRERLLKQGITKKMIKANGLKAFPSISKKELVQNFDRMITVDDISQKQLIAFDEQEMNKEQLFKGRYHLVHSSGSTGNPVYFLYDEKAWHKMLVGIIRAALWKMSFKEVFQLLVKKPKILYIAATDGRYGGTLAVGDGIRDLGMPQMHLNVQKPLSEWIHTIKEFDPDIIIGYPSAIKILMEVGEREQLLQDISRVITCGEPLSESLENMFHIAYGCPVVNVYGASESLALGVGTTGEQGITLFDDMNIIEIEEDKIYLTCLYNYAQPIIRYEMSDELVLEKDHETAFTVVQTIRGRNEEMLWFQDDDGRREFIHPLSIEGICIQGLTDYQFRKIGPKKLEMIAEIQEKQNKQDVLKKIQDKMQTVFKEKHLEFVLFSIRMVDCIYPDAKTGKKKLVITE